MYELSARLRFSAAHHLVGYEGKCSNPHGHNWDVEVTVRGDSLDDSGLLLDFGVLKGATNEVLHELDHKDLNEVSAFVEVNPTSENIARWLYNELSSRINTERYHVWRVSVQESPETMASYMGEA